jgi:acyl-CoA synthetase (AMP-forming)/AMP-acid ligase II
MSTGCPEGTNLVEILRRRAATDPHRLAYRFLDDRARETESVPYGELDRQARSVAAGLQSRTAPGDRVLLMLPSAREFIVAFLGCLYAGRVAVPAYPPRPNQSLDRLNAIVRDARPAVAIATSAFSHSTSVDRGTPPEWGEMSQLTLGPLLEGDSDPWKAPAVAGEIAFLQYTSGSTCDPKGVMVSHANVMANQEMIAQAFGHSEQTVVAGWQPLFHDMGLIGNVLQPLYLGVPCILMPPTGFLLKPRRWLEVISRYRVTTSGGPNFGYDLCVQKISEEDRAGLDLSCWSVAFNGSEPVRAATLDRFVERFGPCGFRREAFYPCYGLAEATLFVCGGAAVESPVLCQAPPDESSRPGAEVSSEGRPVPTRELVSCGYAWSGAKVVIVDPEAMTVCPAGRIGEVWVSGPNVALGYWNRPDDTTFHGRLGDGGEGPFLRTGDLGFFQSGQLFITGRLKEVIIIRGTNYYANDIERVVEDSHPALRRGGGAAFALEDGTGTRLVVVHELERNALRSDVNEIVSRIRQGVAEEHALRAHAICLLRPGSIPRTSSGKVRRYLCRAAYLDGTLDVVAGPPLAGEPEPWAGHFDGTDRLAVILERGDRPTEGRPR